jgi:hypothetical protein
MRIAQDVIRRPAVHVGAEADCRLDAAHGRFTGDGALRPRWTNSPRLYPSEPPLLSPYFRRYISGNPSSNRRDDAVVRPTRMLEEPREEADHGVIIRKREGDGPAARADHPRCRAGMRSAHQRYVYGTRAVERQGSGVENRARAREPLQASSYHHTCNRAQPWIAFSRSLAAGRSQIASPFPLAVLSICPEAPRSSGGTPVGSSSDR